MVPPVTPQRTISSFYCYHNKIAHNDLDRDPKILKVYEEDLANNVERLVFSMHFLENGRLNLFEPATPLHRFYMHSYDPYSPPPLPILTNRVLCTIDPESRPPLESFIVGMPFNFSHQKDVYVDWSDEGVCQTSFLALGMTECPDRVSGQPRVFIMQAQESIVADCSHEVDLEDGRRNSSWTPLALLAGFKVQVFHQEMNDTKKS